MNPCPNCGAVTDKAFCPSCEYMTQPQARDRLKISRSTWYRMLKERKLHLVRRSFGKTLVKRSEVEAIWKEGETQQ